MNFKLEMFVYIYYKVYYYFWANQQSRTYTDRKKIPMRPSSSSAESKYQITLAKDTKKIHLNIKA